MSTLGPVPGASPTFALTCVSYAAFVFHLYEWLTDIWFEIDYIWGKPSSSIIKWQYIFSRYVGLVVPIVNSVLYTVVDPRQPPRPEACRTLLSFQAVTIQTLLLSLNISLAHRLLALYNRRPLIVAFLIGGVLLDFTTGVFACVTVTQGFEMRGACMVEAVPRMGAYTIIEPLIVHGSIWILTLLKFGKIRAPILTLVLRDGSVVFCAMLALLAGLFVSFIVGIGELTQYCFPLMAAIATSANCRIIKNMEVMGVEASKNDSGVEFTTFANDSFGSDYSQSSR